MRVYNFVTKDTILESLDELSKYLTNWGLVITALSFTFGLAEQYLSYKHNQENVNIKTRRKSKCCFCISNPWKYQLILSELSLTLEIIITLFFWLVLADPEDFSDIKMYEEHALPIIAITRFHID